MKIQFTKTLFFCEPHTTINFFIDNHSCYIFTGCSFKPSLQCQKDNAIYVYIKKRTFKNEFVSHLVCTYIYTCMYMKKWSGVLNYSGAF